MKVSTNTIGNYSPAYVNTKAKNKTENIQNAKSENIELKKKNSLRNYIRTNRMK